MSKELLVSGFNAVDSNRVDIFLTKLFPYFAKGEFMIVGGLAVRFHLTRNNIGYPIRNFNDLDIEVPSIDAIKPSVQKEFLIYHYHQQINDSFFVALADPVTGIKVDIFEPAYKHRNRRFVVVNFHNLGVKVTEVEDQLVKTVFDISRISEKDKVDPKQFSDTELLVKVANMKLASQIWREENYEKYPKDISDAMDRANEIAMEHPSWIEEKPFRRNQPYVCEKCKNANGFVVAPMDEVYKVLKGYVE